MRGRSRPLYRAGADSSGRASLRPERQRLEDRVVAPEADLRLLRHVLDRKARERSDVLLAELIRLDHDQLLAVAAPRHLARGHRRRLRAGQQEVVLLAEVELERPAALVRDQREPGAVRRERRVQHALVALGDVRRHAALAPVLLIRREGLLRPPAEHAELLQRDGAEGDDRLAVRRPVDRLADVELRLRDAAGRQPVARELADAQIAVVALHARHGDEVDVRRRRPREVGELLVRGGQRQGRRVRLREVLEEHAAARRVGDALTVRAERGVALARWALGDRGEPLARRAVDEEDVLVVVERELREAGGHEERDRVTRRGLGAAGRLRGEQRAPGRGVEDPLGRRDELVVGELLGEGVDLGAVDRGDHDVLLAATASAASAAARPATGGAGARAALVLRILALALAVRVGEEDVDRRALLDDLVLGRDLALDRALGIRRRGRALPHGQVLVAQSGLGVGERHPDHLRHGDLAVADGDQHRHLLTLLRLLAGCRRLADHAAGRRLGVRLLLRRGGELQVGVRELLLGVEGRLGAHDVRHHHVLGQQQIEHQGDRGEQDRDRHEPPGQPRLLLEDALRREQRPGRRACAAALLAGQLELVRVEVHALHLRALHLRAADLRLLEGDAARADLHARLVDLRLVDARAVDAGDVAAGRAAPEQALLLRLRGGRVLELGGGRRLRGEALLGLLAREGVDGEAVLRRAADPDLLGRAHLHARLDRLAGRDLVRRAVEAEVQLVVLVLALERDQDGRVGLVLDGDVEVGLPPALAPLRPDGRRGLRVGLDDQAHRRGCSRAALGLGVREDPELPQLRLGLGRAWRVDVDLHLLLVGAARAERDEVDRVGVDRPPVVGHPLDAQLVVVDAVALVAHERHHAVALARLDREGQRVLVVGVLVGQAQRDPRALGLLERGLRRLGGRRRRDGHGALDRGVRRGGGRLGGRRGRRRGGRRTSAEGVAGCQSAAISVARTLVVAGRGARGPGHHGLCLGL